MAQADRSYHELTAEEKLAGLVIRRRGLSPPIDVRRLAETIADVEEDRFPVSTDAVAIRRPSSHDRPLIVLNSLPGVSPGRLRFTIAHEIGHLVIPYHPGWIACHVDAAESETDEASGLIEQGANLFASELLMPTPWVVGAVSQEGYLRQIFERIVREANVSYTAARIKIIKCLPPGCLCIETEVAGVRTRVEKSPGTDLSSLIMNYSDSRDVGNLFKKLDDNSSDRCVVSRGSRELRFWKLDFCRILPDCWDGRPSSKILKAILMETIGGSPFIGSITQRVNGMCGAWNREGAADSVESLYGVLKTRFERNDIRFDERLFQIATHPKFDAFLVAKANEMFARRLINRGKESP